jgi:hypothetical protein
VERLAAWFDGHPQATTRLARFAALATSKGASGDWATVSVLEQKTTIRWKCLYLLVFLKDFSGLDVT